MDSLTGDNGVITAITNYVSHLLGGSTDTAIDKKELWVGTVGGYLLGVNVGHRTEAAGKGFKLGGVYLY